MSSHLVDIIAFSPSTKYHEDPINTLAETFQNIDLDASHTFHGRSQENPSEAYIISSKCLRFLVFSITDPWTSAKSSPDTLKEVVASHLGTVDEHFSVNFKGDGLAPMRAPLTEIAFVTIKPESPAEDIARHLDILTGQDMSAVTAATWGRTNVASTWVMVVGWQSKQALEEVVNNPTPEFKTLISNLKNLVDVKVMHAEFAEI
ncbi:hypothetical protein H0H93_007480 [Arthromyces matolae]|nr:hypothetical protein H0H93_007480 [Arthromyces matolae]